MSGDWSDLADMMKNGRIEIKSSSEERAPWRFDVPEVPAHVTALKDAGGTVWLRLPDDTWTANEYVRTVGARFTHMADSARMPLVECPDPRTAS